MSTILGMIILIISQFFANLITHSIHTLKGYVTSAIIGFLAIFASNNLYGNDLNYLRFMCDNEIRCVLSNVNPKVLTHDQRVFYMAKMDFHEENAHRCYNDAKNRSWWLPDTTDRDKARYCFTAIGGLGSPGTPQAKLVRALVTLMLNYGLDCMDEWDYINNKLYWAEYHWDMYEFYANVLVNG